MDRPRVLFRIVPAWSLKNLLRIDSVKTLKNKEVFRIGRMDRTRILFLIVPVWSLKNMEVFEI